MVVPEDLNFKELLKKVKAFIFDVDGVLSKTIVQIGADGELIRTTNVRDGFAIKRALQEGFRIALITGGLSEAVAKRYLALGVNEVYLGSKHKKEDFNDFLRKNNLKPEDVLYMGDDLPDCEVIRMAGIPTCPADAAEDIKAHALYITEKAGGEACVREVIEQVMRTQGNWLKK